MSQSTSDFKVEAGRIIFFGAINSIHSTVTVPKDRRKHDSKSKSESVALIARGYEAFASNKVSSAQYTILNFFPLQLLRQFSKMANLYFLFISILQLVPGWSPTGQYTTLGPLAIFVSLAMLREAIDDRKRHEQDAAENYALTSVLTVNRCPAEAPTARSLIPMSPVQKRDHLFQYYSKPASFATETKKWMDVRVGDIVLLEKDEPVLVDLLILKTSLEEATCFVETNSLDGESNLKQKKGIAVTLNLSEEELISVKGTVHAELPNNNLYEFDGFMDIAVEGQPIKRISLNMDNLLLRGSVLRNTEYVYGVVLFTGEETKIRKNATSTIIGKSPALEKTINRIVAFVFILIIILASLSTGFGSNWGDRFEDQHWYLKQSGLALTEKVGAFFAFVILYNTMIPISLYVTMEMIKLVQAYLISSDVEMFHELSATSARAKTSSLNEDLGQIAFLFSDKTGTLTENIMKFRKFTCNGLNYEVAQPVEDLEIASTRPSLSESRHPTVNRISKLAEDHGIIKPLKTSLSEGRHFSFSRRTKSVEDPIPKVPKTNAPESLHSTLIRKFQGFLHSLHDHGNPTFDFVRDFVLGMALCHGVIVSHPSIPDKPISKSNISFQSSSPDEVAIIRAAKDMGYIFTKRSSTNVHIRIHDTISADLTEMDGFETMFELLASIAFTSQRKRMSTVYRYPDGKIRLICKGADSILFIRLRVPQTDQEKSVLDTTKQHVDSFAMEGLRTLVYGYRDLSEDEYENWAARYHKASTALKDRQAAMDAVAEEIEKELILLGASAVEDQLQDGVPETLENLRRAQIKLWVLTGDKRETAVNVGYASRLLRTKSKLWVVDWETLGGDGVRKFLSLKYEELSGKKTVRNSSRENVERVGTLEQDHNVLIVDGDTLTKMEQADRMAASNSDALGQKYKPILHLLFQLGSLCDSVICCRVSPMQKALVVRCVKNEIAKGKVTLAIGDGANDIAMLREANVGVGISGREGLQAVRASDYSIARFRFLSRLLLVHGHWSYVRVSKFMFGSFYKCMTFYLTQLLFQNFTGVSGTSLYESWTLAGYNLAFSALPVIFVGVFEKDLNEETLLAQPWIYAYGQINGATGLWTIFHWLLSAIYHAFCLLFLPLSFYGIYGSYDISQTNEDSSLYRLGTIVYTAVVFVVNIKISLTESHNVAWPTALITAITIAFWFVYQGVYSIMWPRGNLGYVNYGMFASLQSSASFLFIVILTVTICMLPDIVFRVFQRTFLPTQINYWQEKQKLSRRHLETPPDQSLFSMDRKPGQNNSVP